jgi:hypothetical protein
MDEMLSDAVIAPDHQSKLLHHIQMLKPSEHVTTVRGVISKIITRAQIVHAFTPTQCTLVAIKENTPELGLNWPSKDHLLFALSF